MQQARGYAKKFLGLPYVWGGISLKKGADCSGFCFAVHQKFGITLMRVADDQMKGPTKAYQKLGYKKGILIKDKDLAPGDLVFYDSSKDGVMDHVAMYIGKNKVIHEAGKKYGCVITDIDWAHGRVSNKNMRYWA
jgi:cell wall-associated NlpC family hydrolase